MVAESASKALVLPSMKVMGNISGFLDLVACENGRHEGDIIVYSVHTNTHLQLKPGWWLLTSTIEDGSPQSLLTVGAIPRRPLSDKAAHILDELEKMKDETIGDEEEEIGLKSMIIWQCCLTNLHARSKATQAE